MEKSETDKLKGRIWITARCHMRAEKRNRFIEHFFHITLALSALSSIFVGLFHDPTSVTGFENVIIFTSTCTLSISLLIFGFKFGETAAQHRSCYLDLQKLRVVKEDSVVDADADAKLNIKYIDTLGYYPNHSTGDYLSVTISNIFSAEQDLKDPSGHPLKFSTFSRIAYSITWVIIRILAIVLLLSPVVLALFSIGVV
jgi:hypothetical protein